MLVEPGIANEKTVPLAGFLVDALLEVSDGPALSRQIPPCCTVDPKLPPPATQLDCPALPAAPLVAAGIAPVVPKLLCPADQLDAPEIAPGDLVAVLFAVELEREEIAPTGCTTPVCCVPACRFSVCCVCAFPRQGRTTTARAATGIIHLSKEPFMV
ncbi:MAG: hypothetical protein M1423_00795 [Acidobacteria bacterium]|nr:hypothetical protein [Acidobacteriota bacterium]